MDIERLKTSLAKQMSSFFFFVSESLALSDTNCTIFFEEQVAVASYMTAVCNCFLVNTNVESAGYLV